MYEIEFISDSRFGGSKKKLIAMDRKLKKTGVKIVNQGAIRTIHFPASDINESTWSWRKRYIIDKGNMTWREAITKINKIHAPYYKRV